MKSLIFILVSMFLPTQAYTQTSAIKREIAGNIDWLAGETAKPQKAWVWGYPVPVKAGMYSIRGWLSGRSCLHFAVLFAMSGQQKEAIEWLMAGQAHNDHAANLFRQYSVYSLQYAVDSYWTPALREGGFASGAPEAYQIKNALSLKLENHKPVPMDEPDPEPVHPKVWKENSGNSGRDRF